MQSKINKQLIIAYGGLVVLPLMIIILYLCFFAKDRYESASVLLVKQVGATASFDASGLSALLGVANTSGEDTNILKEYITSRDMVEKLDKSLNLRKAFVEKSDPFFSLTSDAPIEDLVEYFQSRVHVELDEKTMMLQVASQGFTPQFSLKLNQEILNQSDAFINHISQSIATEQLKFAEKQVVESTQKLNQARDALLAYQNKNQMFDPETQAKAVSTIVASLQANLAQLTTEERTLLSYLNPDAPQVVAIRSQIAAVQKQIDDENAKLTSPNTQKLNSKVADFEELKAQVVFATDLYKISLASLEKARLEASRKLKKLVVISTPRLAEDALYPRKVYISVTAFILLNILFGIGTLIYSIVREHRE
ncbi:capsule biosynthesis protein [Acinetobacter sp. MD2]|uniref:capsule biosynthesis protein n=1 Tax=Acinetobacter sp. MD2 TaxID=2600066 RepID=UPI002D1F7653|nr:capsule biosynthesis protein [Acinetobacter sp. MD2]MEB3767528.1 capsule biosynthesis protein [Acinetobacter sp. MD2]